MPSSNLGISWVNQVLKSWDDGLVVETVISKTSLKLLAFGLPGRDLTCVSLPPPPQGYAKHVFALSWMPVIAWFWSANPYAQRVWLQAISPSQVRLNVCTSFSIANFLLTAIKKIGSQVTAVAILQRLFQTGISLRLQTSACQLKRKEP